MKDIKIYINTENLYEINWEVIIIELKIYLEDI